MPRIRRLPSEQRSPRSTDSTSRVAAGSQWRDSLFVAVVVLAWLAVGSCSGSDGSPGGASEAPSGAVPTLATDSVAAGSALYAAHCASCHADDLSGAEDWKTRNDDGTYRPPPQDSSGHTWHHSDRLLVDLIANGSDFPETRMPSFGDVLTDDEILSILDYFKSTWGESERLFQWELTQRDVASP